MNCKDDIIIILDSILDDYFLWECFSEYKQIRKSSENSLHTFSEALIIAYENKYFNFFVGENFNGDEKLIPEFDLNDLTILELLDYKNKSTNEIRITNSALGGEFLNQARR